MPSVNLNKKLENGWSANFKYEGRQSFGSSGYETPFESSPEYELSDFSLIAAKKVGLHAKAAGGYQIRFRPERLEHTFIQQFTAVQRLHGFRLAHQLASDQRFREGGLNRVRIRYRIGGEIALDGHSVDHKEFYLKLSNKYLVAFFDGYSMMEVRLAPIVGFIITDSNKIEVGPDIRALDFFDTLNDRVVWFRLGWYYKF